MLTMIALFLCNSCQHVFFKNQMVNSLHCGATQSVFQQKQEAIGINQGATVSQLHLLFGGVVQLRHH